MNELKVQKIAFQNNVKRLLSPLIIDDDEIVTLMDNPEGMRWEAHGLKKKLQDRLSKSYHLFVITMVEIFKVSVLYQIDKQIYKTQSPINSRLCKLLQLLQSSGLLALTSTPPIK